MPISQEVKESLKGQAFCPKCGFNWIDAVVSLNEPDGSFNKAEAINIIENCGLCSIRFQEDK